MKDFEIQPDGQVYPPSIEVHFRDSSHPCIAVSVFMDAVIKWIANGFEMMLAHLCSANTEQANPPVPLCVGMLPESRRRWKHVRFYFGTTYLNGEFIPID